MNPCSDKLQRKRPDEAPSQIPAAFFILAAFFRVLIVTVIGSTPLSRCFIWSVQVAAPDRNGDDFSPDCPLLQQRFICRF